MSRWRDHEREDGTGRPGGGGGGGARPERVHEREVVDRAVDREVPSPYADTLDLPRGEAREAVAFDGAAIRLNGNDVRVLAAVGTFRAVPVADLGDDLAADRGTLRHLRDSGLLEVHAVSRDTESAGREASVAVLTSTGKALLDAHRRPSDASTRQQFHAGLVKPQELAHDASLYRVYRAAEADLAAEGRHVTRVVLDYEIKADYQRFLNRADRPDEATIETDRATFAAARGLSVIDEHLEVPDLRLEFEGPNGERGVRDVELVTEHYSRSQLAGKARAGFAMYRGARAGGSASRGGTPYDPHRITRVLS